MSLNGKYGRIDLAQVLGQLSDTAIHPDKSYQFDTYGYGAQQTKIPLCYHKNDTLIFSPVTDVKDNPPSMRTMQEALALVEAKNKQLKGINTLIFPVAETRLNRRHWVTLHYDRQSETATLIDSRPAYISFWYPKGKMKETLVSAGFPVSRFNTIHQGVQHDDTHCGAWTAANILALTEDNVPVKKLAQRFTHFDKNNLVNHNMDRVNQPENQKRAYQPLKTTFKQRHKGKLSLLAAMASLSMIAGLLAATGGLAVLPMLLGGMTALAGGLAVTGIISAGLIITAGAALLLGAARRKLANHHPQDMQATINEKINNEAVTQTSHRTFMQPLRPSDEENNQQEDEDDFEFIGDKYVAENQHKNENQHTNDAPEDYGFIPGYQQSSVI